MLIVERLISEIRFSTKTTCYISFTEQSRPSVHGKSISAEGYTFPHAEPSRFDICNYDCTKYTKTSYRPVGWERLGADQACVDPSSLLLASAVSLL